MPRRNNNGHPRPGRGLSSRARLGRRTGLAPLPPPSVKGGVVCPHGKKGLTKGDAEERLARYSQETSNRARRPTRIYECPHCGYWHLTSAP